MGFLFSFIGAIAGLWFMSEGRAFFGFLAGMLIGWLLARVLQAQITIRSLVDRVDNLEQRNRAMSAIERAEAKIEVPPATPVQHSVKKAVETPARVSVYEPAATPAPQAGSKPAVAAKVVIKEHGPLPAPEPGMGEHAFNVAKRWLMTGNVPVKVGVILSFFGVAFLLKYAVERELFSIPMSVRYLAVAAFAAGLLTIGWRKREENRVFALSIQGGGIGILFLTVFAALRLHGLLSPTVAFGLLVLITVAAGVLAIKQESRAFAILGTTGGFLAPLLASTGSGAHVVLFSYYLILNCAILGVAWYRPWRELNIIGFGFTFGIGTIWGYQYYEPQFFASVEPFLVLYFLFYTIIAVLFAMRSPPKSHGYVDGTLIFGTPTIAFALQTQLLNDTEYGLAISAAVVAFFYAAIALWLRRTQDKSFALLTQAFVALAVAFGTIAIPLALDDRWTAIAWALEGAALVWIGVRQKTTLAKLSGTALAFAAGAEFFSYGWVHDLGIPVLNGNFIGGVLIALTSLYSAHLLLKDERGREWQGIASIGLLIWGLAWWFGIGFTEIGHRASSSSELVIAMVYFGASFLAMNYAANRLQWLTLWQITLGFLPFAGGAGLIAYGWTDDLALPVLNGNVLGAAIIVWVALFSARKLRTDERADASLQNISIGLLVWGLLFWFGAGSMEIFDRVSASNQLHALLLFGSLSLAAIAFAGQHFAWIAYRRVSLALLPALFVGALAYLLEHDHFLAGLGVIGWLVAFAAHVWILHVSDDDKSRPLTVAHGWGALFFVGLLAIEVSWQLGQVIYNDVWSGSAGLLVLAAGAFALLSERRERRWPFTKHFDAYFVASLLLATIYVLLVVGVSINDPGNPAPLPYIPILNPLDVLSITAVLLAWYGIRLQGTNERFGVAADSHAPKVALAAIAWLLSTMSVIRAVHYFADVAWTSKALMASVSVQSTLSIYWAILGLAGMELGQRSASRKLWMVGAGFMAVVVLKLFVIDLGNSGTLARIISFLGVGVMLLVVGYFAPVPPKQSQTVEE